MYGEMITQIIKKFTDDIITYEQADDLLTAIQDRYIIDDLYVSEGANRDYKIAFKKANKRFKESVKKLKKIASSGDPAREKEFYDEIKKANKAINDGIAEISAIPSTTASTILSFIILDIVSFIKFLIPLILTLGIAEVVLIYKKMYVLFTGIGKNIRNEEDFPEALNMVRQNYLLLCKNNKKILNKLELRYKANKLKKEAAIAKKAAKKR